MANLVLAIDSRKKQSYADIVDVCDELGSDGLHGSAPNALVRLLEESPTFVDTLRRIRAPKDPEAKDA